MGNTKWIEPLRKQYSMPAVTMSQVRTGWFLGSNGQAYKVSSCNAIALKQAVKETAKYKKSKPHVDTLKVLRSSNLDESDRWFLLCEFPLRLFASRELAEASLGKEVR